MCVTHDLCLFCYGVQMFWRLSFVFTLLNFHFWKSTEIFPHSNDVLHIQGISPLIGFFLLTPFKPKTPKRYDLIKVFFAIFNHNKPIIQFWRPNVNQGWFLRPKNHRRWWHNFWRMGKTIEKYNPNIRYKPANENAVLCRIQDFI